MFVKIRDFIKFKDFLGRFPREQAIQRKSKTSRKSLEKWTFLSLAFYNAPSLHTVDLSNLIDSVNLRCIVIFSVLKPLACGRQSRHAAVDLQTAWRPEI